MKAKDFWRLTPTEFWWWADANKPVKMYGNQSEQEVAEVYAETYGNPED